MICMFWCLFNVFFLSLVLSFFTDSPRRISALQWVSWLFALVGVFMVLLAHGHYTIDVLIAYYITTRLFWTYHTLTNNAFLIKVNTQIDKPELNMHYSVVNYIHIYCYGKLTQLIVLFFSTFFFSFFLCVSSNWNPSALRFK